MAKSSDSPWPPELRDHLKVAARGSFGTHLRALTERAGPGHRVWEHSLDLVEQGLDLWVGGLAPFGRRAWVTAAAAAARHVYPIPLALTQEERLDFCFYEDDAPDANDGDPPGRLVTKVEAWLDSPTPDRLEAVRSGIDRTRQNNVWDEDMAPDPESMWLWFLEVGQLTACSVVAGEEGSDTTGPAVWKWPAPICAARAVVCALKTMAQPERDVEKDARRLRAAIAMGFS